MRWAKLAAIGITLAVILTIFVITLPSNNADNIMAKVNNASVLKVNIEVGGEVSEKDYTAYVRNGNTGLEGIVSVVNEDGFVYNYTILNDVGFYSKMDIADGRIVDVDCLHPEQIPPLKQLEKSIRLGRMVDGDNVRDCPVGKIAELEFAGEPFAYCTSDNDLFTRFVGNEVAGTIDYLEKDENGFDGMMTYQRELYSNWNLTCEGIKEQQGNKEMMPLKWAATYNGLKNGRKLTVSNDTCGCKSKVRPCLFMHGVTMDKHGPPTSTYDEYFGNIHKYAPCCASTTFLHLNTDDHEWYSDKLTIELSGMLRSMSSGYNGVIEDVIVVLHSMGNLILASAIEKGQIQLGDSSTWVALQGPMKGSRSMHGFKANCGPDIKWPNKIVEYILKRVGFCPVPIGYMSMVYMNEQYDDSHVDDKFEAVQQIYKQRVDAALCGRSSIGLFSPLSFATHTAALLSNHSTPSDGVVELDSCMAPLQRSFSKQYLDNKFYDSSVNHFDGAFLFGDGIWGAHRKPVKWFECLL